MTLFNPTDLRNRIEQLGDLPTLPHVVQRLATMIASPTVSAEEIGTIIEKSASISELPVLWIPFKNWLRLPCRHRAGL